MENESIIEKRKIKRKSFKLRNTENQKSIFFFILLFLLICILYLQFSLETENQLQQVSLQVIQILITAGIGFLINSIFSKGKLRSYAFSAWRRISDVKKTIARLKTEIQRLGALDESDVSEKIRPTIAIVNELEANILSSEIDWYDVIDEDIENLQRLFELQQQKSDLLYVAESENNDNTETKQQLKNIETKIQEIRSTLPLSAQETLLPISGSLTIQGEQISQNAITRLELAMFMTDRISIRISGLPKGINFVKLNSEAPFELWPSTGSDHSEYKVKGKSSIELGVWTKDLHFNETKSDYESAILFFLRQKGLLEDINELGAVRLTGSKLLKIINAQEFLIAIPKPTRE